MLNKKNNLKEIYKKSLFFVIVLVIVMQFFSPGFSEVKAETLAVGKCGDLEWECYWNNNLEYLKITGSGDYELSGEDGYPSWKEYSDVYKIYVEVTDITSMRNMFVGCCASVVDFSGSDTSNVKDMSGMFRDSSIGSIKIDSGFDTSNVTDMSGMFKEFGDDVLDVSSFDTSKVLNMESMFCDSHLEVIDISNFDTSKVINMSGMFGFTNVSALDLSNFNTSNVQDMSCMFLACEYLEMIDLSNFDTSNVQDMRSMFDGDSRLTELNISKFDTANVIDMSQMFFDCSSLKYIDVSNFDTINVQDMSYMFDGCDSLKELNLSNFDLKNVVNMYRCFYVNSVEMEKFYVPLHYNVNDTETERRTADLPLYKMYESKTGKEYYELPRNLEKSILLVREYSGNKDPIFSEPDWRQLSQVTAQKEKNSYEKGERITLDDLDVTAVYSDGSSVAVTDYTTNLSELNTIATGKQILIITYSEDGITRTAEVEITVTEGKGTGDSSQQVSKPTLKDIKISKAKTHYYVGDILNLDDLKISAVYEDGTEKSLNRSDCDIQLNTVYFKPEGDKTVLIKAGQMYLFVYYEENGIKKEASILLQIVNNPAGEQNSDTSKSTKPAKVTGLKVKAKGSGKISITWKKAKNASKYQVQIATKKNYKKGKKTKIVSAKKYTWKKLKKGKTYYVRVRAYNFESKKYGSWSSIKKIKVK